MAPSVVAAGLCVAFGVITTRPDVSAADELQLAQRFAFETVSLNTTPPNARRVRPVQPSLENIQSWISSVGAAVALADVRGTGRPADACLVDARDDTVSLLPVPGAGGESYDRVLLTPSGLDLDATMAPMGCVPADLNEDGALDFLVYYWGRSPVLFLGTQGKGIPALDAFRPVELMSPTQVWNSTVANVADVDGDGHLDVLVGNYFPDGARVLDVHATDDRMQMQDGMGLARNAGVNRLLLLRPTGTPGSPPGVRDVSVALPDSSARSWTLALGFQDLTGDQLPELYVANDFGPDQLLVNGSSPGRARFHEATGVRDVATPRSEVLGNDSFKGMGVTFTYPNGQGLPMIVVSNITTNFALHESNLVFVPTGSSEQLRDGRAPFDERSEELGLARGGWCWDVKAGDFDNSFSDELLQATGFIKGEHNRWPELQELAMGNDELLRYPWAWPKFRPGDDLSGHEHNPFWVAMDGGRYTDLADPLGIAAPYVSRGFALGDVNGDDRLDVLVANQWENSVLLRNTASNAGPAADLRLVRRGAAGGLRDAVGTQVELAASGKRYKTQLYPANGHAGVSASEVHLALPSEAPTPVTVTWRGGGEIHRAAVSVEPGHHTVLLEDDGTAVPR